MDWIIFDTFVCQYGYVVSMLIGGTIGILITIRPKPYRAFQLVKLVALIFFIAWLPVLIYHFCHPLDWGVRGHFTWIDYSMQGLSHLFFASMTTFCVIKDFLEDRDGGDDDRDEPIPDEPPDPDCKLPYEPAPDFHSDWNNGDADGYDSPHDYAEDPDHELVGV